MAVLQMMPGDKQTSFELANVYIETLLHIREADIVVDVFDRYDNKKSVKSAERERRQNAGPVGRQYQVIAGRSIPPWKEVYGFVRKQKITQSVPLPVRHRKSM